MVVFNSKPMAHNPGSCPICGLVSRRKKPLQEVVFRPVDIENLGEEQKFLFCQQCKEWLLSFPASERWIRLLEIFFQRACQRDENPS